MVFLRRFSYGGNNMCDDSYYDYLDYIDDRCMNDPEDCGCWEDDDDEDS